MVRINDRSSIRYSKYRMDVLKALYESEDWVTSNDLRYLNMTYRSIQGKLLELYQMGFVHREETYGGYRYKIDKEKSLSEYLKWLEIFRISSQKQGQTCLEKINQKY